MQVHRYIGSIVLDYIANRLSLCLSAKNIKGRACQYIPSLYLQIMKALRFSGWFLNQTAKTPLFVVFRAQLVWFLGSFVKNLWSLFRLKDYVSVLLQNGLIHYVDVLFIIFWPIFWNAFFYYKLRDLPMRNRWFLKNHNIITLLLIPS